jgi:signal transduction histidine kinase/CheY-like chemotaxis protein
VSDGTKGSHSVLLRQQTVLARFGELALRSDNLDEILTEACHLVGEALGTDLAKIVELKEDGRTLLVRAGVGWKLGVVGKVTVEAEDDTSEGIALKTGEPMISPDIGKETRFEYPPFLINNGVQAVANVVIIGGQGRRPFGILQIDSRKPRHFTEEDTFFLRSYANLVAAAVDRLRVNGGVRNAEERLRLALEAGEMGSWEIHLSSRAAIGTPRNMQIFGYARPPPHWGYDLFLNEHVLAEDRDHVSSTFNHAVDTGTEWHFECRIRRAGDAEIRWIEVRGKPTGAQGDAPPTHMIGIVADITARKAAEEGMQRSNEMLEMMVAKRTRELVAANEKLRTEAEEREQIEEELRQSHKMEAVGQLTGGLAHDFNNLLAGISGSLELIRLRLAQGRTTELNRYVEASLASVGRAAALTHRLLAFSRRQPLEPKSVRVDRLVDSLEDLLRGTVGPSIEIETTLADGLWLTWCDPNQLENALLNLVINARDAMPDGGHLAIETANIVLDNRRATPGDVPLRSVPSGDYIVLSVTDTGVGMSATTMTRAFDPFFTTKPLGQGTGLGLSMIYGFVQQTGGHIHLRSGVGQGTTVTIYLPRCLGVVEAQADSGAAVGPSLKATAVVLVVEDELPVQMVISDLLSDLGYTVLAAGDARSGLKILEAGTLIDLLVSDIGLPGSMNGRQLADAAQLRHPNLKVLFLTGYAEITAVGSSLLEHGIQIMTKPFALEALAARIQGMIGG